MTPAEYAARSRAAQGLPERVEDPSVLAAVTTLLGHAPASEADEAVAA